MYSNEQSRINAIISYFFLGPFFLFAKKDTPLSDPYVQTHAKSATKYIVSMLILSVVYLYFRGFLSYGIPGIGISISTIVIASIVGLTLMLLLRGAYFAYNGIIPGGDNGINTIGSVPNLQVSGVYTIQSEEEKSRILASMIPFLGIWIANKYHHEAMKRARIIGSFMSLLYILSLFLSGDVGFIPFLILLSGIVLFVIEAIYLFLYSSFVSWNILDKIPSYLECEAHIIASSKSVLGFFLEAFGKNKLGSYHEYYEDHLAQSELPFPSFEKYFMPAGLIGFPFWNLFALPSLFVEKYRPYRNLIIEGLIVTGVFSYFFFYKHDFANPYLLLFLFPIVHIGVYASTNPNTHTPGIGLLTHFFSFMKKTKKSILESTVKNGETFSYETPSSRESNINK